jgi:hypothetical protein
MRARYRVSCAERASSGGQRRVGPHGQVAHYSATARSDIYRCPRQRLVFS